MRRKKTSKVKFWAVIGLVLVLVGAGIWFQLNRSAQNRIANTPTYRIQPGEISLVSLATGKLSSAEQTRIRVSGSVTRLDVSLGQRVEQGDVLAQYQRQSIEAETLRAPRAGIVTQMPSALNPQLLIATLDQLQLDINVAQSERNRFRMNQAAEIYVEAIDTTFYGRVASIAELSLSPTSQFTVSLVFDRNAAPAVLGMSAVAKVELEGYGDYFASGRLSAANPIEINVSGTVVRSLVAVGDRVERNTPLVEWIPSSSLQELRSSASGVVTQVPGALGNEFVISESDQLELIINISEIDIHKLRLNQSARIYVEAIDRFFEGFVSDISNVGNTNLDYTTYPVTLQFNPDDAPLFIGMSASAQITVETKSNILVVPFEALVSEGTNRYVISAEWLNNSTRPRSDFYIPVKTGIADVFTIEVIGDNLLNQEIIIIEASAGFPFFGPNR